MNFLSLMLSIFSIFAPAHQEAMPVAKTETVQLVKVVDGDTIKVKYKNEVKTVRMLLIDTPESKKPNTPVQPYSLEATRYLEQTLKGNKISLEFDKGAKEDKYGRLLAYVYSNNQMVNKSLVRNGYARVGYVYSQKKHLNELNYNQKLAQKEHLRIWSKPNYVNSSGEGFNSKEISLKDQIKENVKKEVKKQAKKELNKFIKGIF